MNEGGVGEWLIALIKNMPEDQKIHLLIQTNWSAWVKQDRVLIIYWFIVKSFLFI